MTLRAAFQMDPIENLVIRGDSSFALMLEARRRGHELLYYRPGDLLMREARAFAHMRPVEVRDEEGDHYTLGERTLMPLSDCDVVMLRQDPPFDMSYITTTHILEAAGEKTLVVNDPASVRNSPEDEKIKSRSASRGLSFRDLILRLGVSRVDQDRDPPCTWNQQSDQIEPL